MLHLFRKTLAVCLIGFGIGLLLVVLLPFTGWLFIIRFSTCWSWYSMALFLKIKGSEREYDNSCKKSS